MGCHLIDFAEYNADDSLEASPNTFFCTYRLVYFPVALLPVILGVGVDILQSSISIGITHAIYL